ncbi:VOC family protein [Methylibium sp.]|uniref:VOC family protein n=1 Tax=Methylibium sp. TaxID=2067992 RepID=UPI003D09E05C
MSSTRASGALHNVTPYLMYRDAAGGIAFCIAAFGATERMRHVEPDGRIAHAQLQIGDSLLMVSQANPAFPEMPAVEDCEHSPMSLFLEVDDADATVERALVQGARLVYAVADRDYGRSGSVRDPYGYHWHITSPVRAA